MREISANRKRFAELCLEFIRKSIDCDEEFIYTTEGDLLLDRIIEVCAEERENSVFNDVISTAALIDALKFVASYDGVETENGKRNETLKDFSVFLEKLFEEVNKTKEDE